MTFVTFIYSLAYVEFLSKEYNYDLSIDPNISRYIYKVLLMVNLGEFKKELDYICTYPEIRMQNNITFLS